MGGKIWVESAPGQGSRFYFTLELEIEPQAPAAEAGLVAELAGRRSLVVDDNETNRRVLEKALASWGMETETADGAQAALEAVKAAQARGRPFSLFLLDMDMPEVDGLELARRLREDGVESNSIILLTSLIPGDASEPETRKIVGQCLTKPIRQRDLREAVQRALPLTPEAPPVTKRNGAAEERSIVARPGLAVLVAEDNRVNQAVARRLLEKLCCEVSITVNGAEALEQWKQGRYDIVFMDVQMPDMDGLEATRLIRACEESELVEGRRRARTPIVAMTAHALTSDRERCLAAGMDGYISKPIAIPAILEALRESGLMAEPAGMLNAT